MPPQSTLSATLCLFMVRRPPRPTRTDTLFPFTTLFRSPARPSITECCPVIDQIRAHANRSFRPPLALLDQSAPGSTQIPEAINASAYQSAPTLHRLAARWPVYLRSEERRVGKECVSTCRSRWSPYH